MKTANVAEAVKSEHAVALLKQMYGENRVEENAARYQLVADGFAKEFGDKAFEFFSAPGRTEIGGNHTDHNHGKVLAGSVHLDCVAAAAPNGTHTVNLISETYNQHLVIDLDDLAPTEKTTGTEPSLPNNWESADVPFSANLRSIGRCPRSPDLGFYRTGRLPSFGFHMFFHPRDDHGSLQGIFEIQIHG